MLAKSIKKQIKFGKIGRIPASIFMLYSKGARTIDFIFPPRHGDLQKGFQEPGHNEMWLHVE